MSIAKIIKRCTFVGALLCAITAALPSWADICFLPTRECENSAIGKSAKVKSCQEYVDNVVYFNSEPENMNCTSAGISGCSILECHAKTCADQGYRLGATDSASSLPAGYSNDEWRCDYCKQGDKYYWKCLARPCDAPYKTASECTSSEVWQNSGSASTHRSGHEACGTCVEARCNSDQMDTIPSGCEICVLEETFGGYKSCYKCKPMTGYVSESEYFANYDSSCYDNRTKQAADGTICYKPLEKSCPDFTYREEELVNGKKICKCNSYGYVLTADKTKLQFSAAGGESIITVTSQRVGLEREDWDFSVSSMAGICSVTRSGDFLTVKCGKNTKTDGLEYALVLTQTGENGADVNSLTIDIVIDADSCASGQLSAVCTDSGCEAQANGTLSDAGQTCYDCVQCRSGVRAAVKNMVVKGFNAVKNLFN